LANPNGSCQHQDPQNPKLVQGGGEVRVGAMVGVHRRRWQPGEAAAEAIDVHGSP